MALESICSSDAVTASTDGELRKVMAEAEVGDDVFGEDPTVRALEERVAEAAGTERRCSCRRARWQRSRVACANRPGDTV